VESRLIRSSGENQKGHSGEMAASEEGFHLVDIQDKLAKGDYIEF
jgi:hypothetical protein